MSQIIKFFFELLYSTISKNRNFVRLNLSTKGKAWFYDKKRKQCFAIHCRDSCDSGTANLIFKHSGYELSFLKRHSELIECYQSIIKEGQKPIILDLGANIGAATHYFAKEFPSAQIIAVEPVHSNCEMIRKNCTTFSNVTISECAVGANAGRTNILDPKADHNAYRMTALNESGTVEVKTVSELLNSVVDGKPFITKIDIEGFESDLFSCNTGWISQTPLLIIETHDWMLPNEANSKNFLSAISRERRDFIHRGENVFSIAIGNTNPEITT